MEVVIVKKDHSALTKLTGRRRRDAAGYWERVFQAVSESITILDKDQTILDCNQSFADLIGKPAEEIIGRKCYELVHNLPGPPDICVACEAMAQQKSVSHEFYEEFLGKEIYASADPFVDSEGEQLVLHLIRDVTAQKRANDLVRQQRDFMQLILDSIPNPVFYKDTEGRYTGCNKAFAEYIGRPRDEIIGKTPFDISPEQLAKLYHERDLKLFEIPGVQTYEAQVEYADGTFHDVIFNKATYLDIDGKVGGLVGVIVDITDRKKAEERMRITQFEVDRAGDIIIRADVGGKILFANDAACRQYGYSREEMLSLSMSDIGVDLTDERWREIIDNEFETSETVRREVRHQRKDRTIFPMEITSSFLEFNGTRNVIIFGRDITERKLAEETLKRVNAELEGYAHTVSHDLRGPIATIMLATETLSLLESGAMPSDDEMNISEVIAIISRSAEKASRLVTDVLALAEAGQVPQDVTEVNVSDVLGNLLEEKAGAIEERGIEVILDDDFGTVLANETHIYQVFTNLIGNSIKHNRADTPRLEIRHLGEGNGGVHNYLVRDNGPGIPADTLDQVFIPFVKGPGTGDTGIGLSTVEKIVKVYGGTISAYNDNGACFEFSLVDYQPVD